MFPEGIALDEFEKEAGVSDQEARARENAEQMSLEFDALFERYRSLVYHLAVRILGEREEALDVTQEVFLAVYRKLPLFRGESSLKTWIYRITINRAANRCRWWKRMRRRGAVSLEAHLAGREGLPLDETLRSQDASPEERVMRLEERAYLERSLAKLPLQQRLAVVLRDIEGLSYDEIAFLLGVSLGTVKSRICRGREELKRRLNGVLGPCHASQSGGVS
ncbi:MAG: sigma-70 family RNA polymerase sigma factor [Acidobacteria bacterium]|nr:sigma-70 family RNA polymerase sigma factor [Acidobacteriota bacterium]